MIVANEARPAVYIRANRPAPLREVERNERSAAGEFDCVMEEEAEPVAGDGEEVVSAAAVTLYTLIVLLVLCNISAFILRSS